MNANERELILKEEVFSIVSCTMGISNGLGHGLLEKYCEKALAVESQASNAAMFTTIFGSPTSLSDLP